MSNVKSQRSNVNCFIMKIIRSDDNLTMIGGISAILCGLFDILGGMAFLTGYYVPQIPSLVWVAPFTFSNVLILFPIITISHKLIEEGGCVIKAGYIMSIGGLILAFVGFFAPSGFVIYLFGIFMLTLANMQNRQVTEAGMWLWFICIFISLGLSYLNIPLVRMGIFPAIEAVPLIWIGLSLLQENRGLRSRETNLISEH